MKLFDKPFKDREHPISFEGGSGRQRIYKFKNGYGASVVRFKLQNITGLLKGMREYGSYTNNDKEWELGVIKFHGKGWNLTYDTPVTNDVMGYLNKEQVEVALVQIKELPRGK